MGTYVWAVIGVVFGLLSIVMAGQTEFVVRVESLAVGVFSAFAGGEFLAPMMLAPPPKGTVLTVGAVSLSIVSAIVGLLLLQAMRRAVGPLKAGKKKRRQA